MPSLSGRIDHRGPILEVRVMQSHQLAMTLQRSGVKPMPPRVVKGLIDTGASDSAVDAGLVNDLALPATGRMRIHTPTTGPEGEIRLLYDATLAIGADQPTPLVVTTPLVWSHLASQQIFLLIGRDVLKYCVLTYDGPRSSFTLAWDWPVADTA
jgi:hypothetical protein